MGRIVHREFARPRGGAGSLACGGYRGKGQGVRRGRSGGRRGGSKSKAWAWRRSGVRLAGVWVRWDFLRLVVLVGAFAGVLSLYIWPGEGPGLLGGEWSAGGGEGYAEDRGAGYGGAVPVPANATFADPAALFECRVKSVYDGDTLTCFGGTRVRLQAVAAREMEGNSCRPGHPCPAASARAARDTLRALAPVGRTLTCERTGTSYDRVTAWCWNGAGQELSCGMVESGTALLWAKYDPAGEICRRRQVLP